jgi:GntR family transcriptional regulator/MocR family aminotransferase
MDLPIIVNKSHVVPLHRQLTKALRDAIRNGSIAPKQTLPSSRELAQSLAISRRTVVRSYNDLISQGYLETTFGGGTFVHRSPPVEDVEPKEQEQTEEVDERYLSQFTANLLRSETEMLDFGQFARLNYCAAPADLLPTKQWRQALSKYLTVTDTDELDYVVDIFGYRPLREEICRYLRRSKALNCDADQMIAFSDTFTCLDLIARTLINPGDLVVVENPGYIYARQLFEAYGAKIIPVTVDENGLVVSELAKISGRVKLIHVTPSHQDPTGVVMPVERRHALLAWANEHCDFIIEDGFDSDYFYSSAPLPSLHGLNQGAKVLYIYSFWKILYPLVAAGYLVVPTHLLDAFGQTKQHVNRFFNNIEQHALADFISEGHLERHWHKTRAIYKKRRQALMFALRQAFRDKVSFFGEGAGLHLTIRLDLPTPTEELADCAESVGLPLVSTATYFVRDPVAREYLIPFCSIPEERAMDLVVKFADAVKQRFPSVQKEPVYLHTPVHLAVATS